jgi:hypothetical protein
MVENEDNRRVARHVFETRDLDALEVNPEREFEQGNYEIAEHFWALSFGLWALSFEL